MRSLSISRVFGRTFTILRERWISWALLVGGLSYAPALLFEAARWQLGQQQDISVIDAIQGLPDEMPIMAILSVCLNVGAAHGVFDSYRGRASTAAAWVRGLSSIFWPCLGLTIIVNLAVVLGLVLLVIPGLFAMAILSVALPARVAEGKTVDHAIRRSMDLTKGSRWQIFAVIPIGTVGFFVLSMINEVLVVGWSPLIGTVLCYPLLTAIAAAMISVISPVMYEELIAAKGGRADETSDVFA